MMDDASLRYQDAAIDGAPHQCKKGVQTKTASVQGNDALCQLRQLEEARAIVQSSVNWDGAAESRRVTRTGSVRRALTPPPCFLLFSDPNGSKIMEALVRRGVQLTLEADPDLKALVTRQQEHRLQSPHSSPRRPSVSFSGAVLPGIAAPSPSPSLTPSPRYSILKKPTQRNLLSSSVVFPASVLAITTDKLSTPIQAPASGSQTTTSTRDTTHH
ncbi:unnamed protein product [Phytophthora fragariaefolia]|uniref:Unnamed protein product n=1 Tax=Phytophthora fragariaefolia TaxID=1490495 RepID=A0A9W6X7T0_9STRA|nr:unnamed protein product [Phytophthora fragariaefolia]